MAFDIYPSPNNGNFTIKLNTEASGEIFVYDITEKLEYTKYITGNTASIQVTDAAKGIHFVKVQVGNEETTKKISVE